MAGIAALARRFSRKRTRAGGIEKIKTQNCNGVERNGSSSAKSAFEKFGYTKNEWDIAPIWVKWRVTKLSSSSTAVVFRGKWQVMPSSAAPFVWAAMAQLNGSRFRKRVGKNVATPS